MSTILMSIVRLRSRHFGPGHGSGATTLGSLLPVLALALGCAPGASTPFTSSPEPSAASPAADPSPTPPPPIEAAPPHDPPSPPATHCTEWSTTLELPLAFALRDGWVGADGSAVLVGDGSTIVHHRDGRWWTEPAPSEGWTAVWGSGPDDVFAVSYFGTIAHFDGHAWSEHTKVDGVRDVWGTGPDHVIAVGEDGIHQYDGTTWSHHRLTGLRAVWGTAPDHVLVAGVRGRLLRYDGERWTEMQPPTSAMIFDLSGTGPDDVYATTEQQVLHFDGQRWSRSLEVSLDDTILATPFLGGGSTVMAIQDQDEERYGRPPRGSTDIRVHEGDRWGRVDLETAWLTGGATSAADHTYVFDNSGGIHRYDRSGLRAVVEPIPANWRSMHRIAGDRIAVTHDFQIWREHDGQWQQVPSLRKARWYDAWIDESGRVLAVGSVAGRAAVMVRDGDEWQPLWRGPRRSEAQLTAIRSSGPGEYLAVGNHGLVVHGDAAAWTIEPTRTNARLRSLWMASNGRAYAVGETVDASDRGVILERADGRWTKARQRVPPLADVWGVGDHLYASGGVVHYDFADDDMRGEAEILRLEGEAWTRAHIRPREEAQTYDHIAGNTPDDVFALRVHSYGDGGEDYSWWALDHFDGKAWTEHAKGDGSVGSLSVTPDEVIVSTGYGLHRWICRHPGTGATGE